MLKLSIRLGNFSYTAGAAQRNPHFFDRVSRRLDPRSLLNKCVSLAASRKKYSPTTHGRADFILDHATALYIMCVENLCNLLIYDGVWAFQEQSFPVVTTECLSNFMALCLVTIDLR